MNSAATQPKPLNYTAGEFQEASTTLPSRSHHFHSNDDTAPQPSLSLTVPLEHHLNNHMTKQQQPQQQQYDDESNEANGSAVACASAVLLSSVKISIQARNSSLPSAPKSVAEFVSTASLPPTAAAAVVSNDTAAASAAEEDDAVTNDDCSSRSELLVRDNTSENNGSRMDASTDSSEAQSLEVDCTAEGKVRHTNPLTPVATTSSASTASKKKNNSSSGRLQAPPLSSLSPCSHYDDDDCSYYDSDDDNCDSWYHTPFQIASSVQRRQLHSGQKTIRVIDPNCPSKDMVMDSGFILIKTKRGPFRRPTFEEHYWIRYGRHCLYFFHSRKDGEEWIHNKRLDKEAREKLVALNIDFERDSVSDTILGYKSTCTYLKRYRGFDELHVSKLYQWKTQGSVAVGTIVPNKTATFASKCIESGEKLHNIIMGMIGCNPSNLRLQHRLLAASQCYSLMNKIESFDSIEYHDDFADWLLQTKLEESGFIVTAPTLTKIGTTDNDFEDKLVSR